MSSNTNPYASLPSRNFWRPSVGESSPNEIGELWEPRFEITKNTRVATYGSCFAQHLGRNLDQRGYKWLITETPHRYLSADYAKQFNYNIFSSRTGNIYTTSLLVQWLTWTLKSRLIPNEVWFKDGRVYDPFRPTVERNGFADVEEMRVSRAHTLRMLKESVQRANVFIFTLGLTESWRHRSRGYEYPMCPGTAAGEFDPKQHEFVNQDYETVLSNLKKAIKLLRRINPSIKVLLTVSPVPLTATRSDDHVMVATTYSKSVLRAVAGAVVQSDKNVDYFPSYELVTAPPFEGRGYEDNKRSMNPDGVAFVMGHFFAALGDARGPAATALYATPGEHQVEQDENESPDQPRNQAVDEEDVVCDEVLLDAFGRSPE